MRYYSLIQSNVALYQTQTTSREEKQAITKGILRDIHGYEPRGRFIKLDKETNTFNEVDDKKAYIKIQQAVGDRRKLETLQVAVATPPISDTPTPTTIQPTAFEDLPSVTSDVSISFDSDDDSIGDILKQLSSDEENTIEANHSELSKNNQFSRTNSVEGSLSELSELGSPSIFDSDSEQSKAIELNDDDSYSTKKLKTEVLLGVSLPD